MSINRPELVNGKIYHIVVRGVGDSEIFIDESDYYRAIFSLYEFNTTEPVEIRKQREKRKLIKISGGQTSATQDRRDFLVEILAFCLMPNHIHLLLRQLKNNGISEFMRKFGTGYAGYFNRKYNRKGHLFQGRFKAVLINTEKQLQIAFVYIHTNPISLNEPKWREKGIKNLNEVMKFLKNYKWSSYLDYIGIKNFPSVTKRDFLLKIIGGKEMCENFVKDWIKHKKETEDFPEIAIE